MGYASLYPPYLHVEIFRAPSSRDAIDGRDKNERGEDFNLSRQTGKERPCAGSFAGAIAAVCLSPAGLRAEVIRFDIVERAPAFAGRSFGDVGPYERITARATIALNPSDDRNAVITDLAQAPRNRRRQGGSDHRRRDPAARRCRARQRHAAAGRAQSRPQARAATVRRFIAARREQRARRRRRRHRLPAPPGLHDGLGRLAGRHSLEARTDGADRAGAEGRDRTGARGIRLRHHDQVPRGRR